MAAALFNKKMEKMGFSDRCQAQSAGTWGRDGFPADDRAMQVMRERGIDITSHRSREVNVEIINAADLILTMEKGHKEALQIEFPNHRGKIWLLSEISDPDEYSIPDPYGGTLDDFEEVAVELESIINEGITGILQRACPDLLNR